MEDSNNFLLTEHTTYKQSSTIKTQYIYCRQHTHTHTPLIPGSDKMMNILKGVLHHILDKDINNHKKVF